MEAPKDKLGQEIRIGSFIVYGHALGRCAGLRLGMVRELHEVDDPYAYNRRPKKKWHFRIRGMDGEGWNSKEKPSLLTKDSTLQFADRIVVLPPEMVPENVKKLYEEA